MKSRYILKLKDSVEGTLQDKNFVNYLTSTAGLCHLYEEGDKEFRGPSGEYTYLKGMPDDFGGDTNTIRTYDEGGTPLIKAKSVKDYFYKFAELSGSDFDDEYYQYYLESIES